MKTIASIRFSDLLALSISSLKRNRLRSILTIGAIAVGISVMMYLISFGLGMERLTLRSVAESRALLSISVTSGSKELQPLNQKAVTKIKTITNLEEVLPQLTVKGEVNLENTKAAATIVGVDPEFLNIDEDSKLVIGRYYHPEDQEVAVVTSGFLKLFGLEENKTPQVSFDVLLDAKDYPSAKPLQNIVINGVSKSDSVVMYLPRPYLEKNIGTGLPDYDTIKVIAKDLNNLQPVSDILIANGFKASKIVDRVEEIKKVFFWVQIVMAALGLIAIVVASIGMFNTLTISLLERTKEIGIMKALGVRKSDISRLFFMESLLMGLLGGIAGILLGFFFQQVTLFLLSLLATLAQGTVPVIFFNHWLVIVGFIGFGMAIALLTGIYPAVRASKINTIEAIRYE